MKTKNILRALATGILLYFQLLSCLAQNMAVKKTYYDYARQHIHEEYQFIRTAGWLELKNGFYREYFENGMIKQKRTYQNGKLDGVFTAYENWGNGPEILEIINFKSGLRHGYYCLWWFNEEGERLKELEGYYYNDKPDKRWARFEHDGSKLSENWTRGIRDGETVLYDAAGNIKRAGRYDNGKATFSGTVEERYATGKLKRAVEYDGGFRDGFTKTWYPSGVLKTSTHYTHGEPDSDTLRYLPTGKPDAETKEILEQQDAAPVDSIGHR